MEDRPEFAYYLMLKDNKGDDEMGGNVVVLNAYDSHERDQAFAELEILKLVCDATVTAWLEVEVLPPPVRRSGDEWDEDYEIVI